MSRHTYIHTSKDTPLCAHPAVGSSEAAKLLIHFRQTATDTLSGDALVTLLTAQALSSVNS